MRKKDYDNMEFITAPTIKLKLTKKEFYGCDCEYVDKYHKLKHPEYTKKQKAFHLLLQVVFLNGIIATLSMILSPIAKLIFG